MNEDRSAEREVKAWQDTEELVSEGAARRIAAWYQSPGKIGADLAAFASGGPATPATLEDVERTMRELNADTEGEHASLYALQAWLEDTYPLASQPSTADGYTIREGMTVHLLSDGRQSATVRDYREAKHAEHLGASELPSWWEVEITITDPHGDGGEWTGGVDAGELYADASKLP
jgi:hypothetical protein